MMAKKISQALKVKIKKIKLIILDVDGILTPGKIVIDSKGEEIKYFNVQDGFGLVLFRKAGFKTAILSARSSKAVSARARDLKIDKVCQDAYPKGDVYRKILKHFNLKNENVCFMGDDLPDLAVLKQVGFAVTVPNGSECLTKHVDYLTKNKGGHGAVREVVELILKTQNKWKAILEEYS